jgi:hypothetical protein
METKQQLYTRLLKEEQGNSKKKKHDRNINIVININVNKEDV